MGRNPVLHGEGANIHPVYRDLLLAAAGNDTSHSSLFDVSWPDAPVRTLRNSTVRAWESAACPSPPRRPGEGTIVARRHDGSRIPRYHVGSPTRTINGEIEVKALYSGEGVGLVREVQPAAEIVAELVAGLTRVEKRQDIIIQSSILSANWQLRCGVIAGPLSAVAFLIQGASRAYFAQVSVVVDLGGVFQRISLIVGLSWLTLLALHVLKLGTTGTSGDASVIVAELVGAALVICRLRGIGTNAGRTLPGPSLPSSGGARCGCPHSRGYSIDEGTGLTS